MPFVEKVFKNGNKVQRTDPVFKKIRCVHQVDFKNLAVLQHIKLLLAKNIISHKKSASFIKLGMIHHGLDG